MKEIIVFGAKLIFLIAIFIVMFFCFVMPQYNTSYNAAILDKYERLSTIDEPKIILVGDSNVAFGFDSQMIEEAFNMPVVNFGLHGGLGQSFHTDMIKEYIQKGDIVIIAPAGYDYQYQNIGDEVLAWITVENHFQLWKGIDSGNYIDMVKAYPTYLKRALTLWKSGKGNEMVDNVYSRKYFNVYGDNIFPRLECIMLENQYGSYFVSSELSEEMRDYWNEYNEYVISKGAVLLMSAPPILEKTLDVNLNVVQESIKKGIDFPMISQLEHYVYTIDYFYDTGFHLNDMGKKNRTEQLINDLSKVMGAR